MKKYSTNELQNKSKSNKPKIMTTLLKPLKMKNKRNASRSSSKVYGKKLRRSVSSDKEPNEFECIQLHSDFHSQQKVSTNAMILEELRALHKKFDTSQSENKRIVCRLTEEIVALRREVLRLQSSHSAESNTPDVVDTTLLPLLPLSSLSEFAEFDRSLALDEEMLAQVKYALQQLQAPEYPTFLRLAIKRFIPDELATGLSWRGTTDKPSIQSFNINNIIKDVCRAKYYDISEILINRVIQQHFLHANDRLKKRVKNAYRS